MLTVTQGSEEPDKSPMAPICHHRNRKEGLEDSLVNKLDFLKIPYKMRILCSIVITHTVKGSWQWGVGQHDGMPS